MFRFWFRPLTCEYFHILILYPVAYDFSTGSLRGHSSVVVSAGLLTLAFLHVFGAFHL